MKLNYIKPLDGLRASAILLVLVWHYFACQINENLFNGSAKYLKLATSWTWSGVDLFFVLSGFLIGRILIHYKGSPNYFKTFYIRRIFRIFPPYYLTLIVFAIIVILGLSIKMLWLSKDIYPFYAYFLYIQNFWMHTDHGAMWLGVTWSLAIEEQFYCILPLLIFVVDLKSLPKFLIGGIILAPIFRLFIPDLGAYVLLPARMDSLLIGVLIAYYYLNGSLQKTFENRGALLFKMLVAFIFLLLCSLILFMKGIGKEGIGGVFTHTALACIYGTLLIMVLVNNHSLLSKVLSNKLLLFISKISYVIYLTHQIFNGLLHQFILNQSPQINNMNDVIVTICAFFVTIGFSTISFYTFEKPIIRLGEKYKY